MNVENFLNHWQADLRGSTFSFLNGEKSTPFTSDHAQVLSASVAEILEASREKVLKVSESAYRRDFAMSSFREDHLKTVPLRDPPRFYHGKHWRIRKVLTERRVAQKNVVDRLLGSSESTSLSVDLTRIRTIAGLGEARAWVRDSRIVGVVLHNEETAQCIAVTEMPSSLPSKELHSPPLALAISLGMSGAAGAWSQLSLVSRKSELSSRWNFAVTAYDYSKVLYPDVSIFGGLIPDSMAKASHPFSLAGAFALFISKLTLGDQDPVATLKLTVPPRTFFTGGAFDRHYNLSLNELPVPPTRDLEHVDQPFTLQGFNSDGKVKFVISARQGEDKAVHLSIRLFSSTLSNPLRGYFDSITDLAMQDPLDPVTPELHFYA